MEQLRNRLTNVSPKGQCCSADQNPLKRSGLDDFVACYNPKNRHERKESERFNPDQSGANRFERKESERLRSFTYEELTKRDAIGPYATAIRT